MPFALNAEHYTRGTIRSFLYLPPSWPFDGIRGCFVAKTGNQKSPDQLYNVGGLVFA
jgi:hypothetical protein